MLGLGLHIDDSLSIVVERDIDRDWPTTDLTVFNVPLFGNGPVDCDVQRLGTVRALDRFYVHLS